MATLFAIPIAVLWFLPIGMWSFLQREMELGLSLLWFGTVSSVVLYFCFSYATIIKRFSYIGYGHIKRNVALGVIYYSGILFLYCVAFFTFSVNAARHHILSCGDMCSFRDQDFFIFVFENLWQVVLLDAPEIFGWSISNIVYDKSNVVVTFAILTFRLVVSLNIIGGYFKIRQTRREMEQSRFSL